MGSIFSFMFVTLYIFLLLILLMSYIKALFHPSKLKWVVGPCCKQSIEAS